MEIEVSSGVVAKIVAAARAAHPLEACGLLLGQGGRIASARQCANVHPHPERHFEIDPQSLIDAHRAARDGGPQVLGYWHSHPVGPAEPSATDSAHAIGDDRIWAIVGDGTISWWRDDRDGFQRVSCAVSDS